MAPARGRGKGQRAVSLEVKRLHLGATPGDIERWPVHGFVVTYLRALTPARVHFCHHTDVVHG